MKKLPEILFWLGIASVPIAWLFWYIGPEFEIARSVFNNIQDPAIKAALQEAHAERWGIFASIWPVTLIVLSTIVEKKVKG